jgi:hypothetical protein
MALSYSNLAKKAACDAILALLNSGQFRLLTAADAELASLTFAATAFQGATTASPAVAQSNSIAADNTVTPGDIAKFELRTSGSVNVISGTVGVGSGDLQITSVTIPGTATSVGCPGGLQYSQQLQ